MKSLHSFNPNRQNSGVSYLRITISSVLVIAAVAMASIALNTSQGPINKPEREVFAKFRQDRDAVAENSLALPGRDRGPFAKAEEDYAHRAYPAKDVPF